jgi:hypothetical protein
LDEGVGPSDGLFNGWQYVETFGGLRIQRVPLLTDDDAGWPCLLLAVVEESHARRGELSGVEALALVEELEVDQVARPFAAFAETAWSFCATG